MPVAFTFPGQGSQSVGMLSDLAAARSVVGETFAEASEMLGYDLWALVSEGPAERLNETERTQPAMLAAGVAVWRAWHAAGGPAPAMVAGHSLGEYSALVCAGAMPFRDAVRAVAARGRFMQEAVPLGVGGIAALLGLDDAAVVEVCTAVSAELAPQHVSAVNFNAPGQVVVAGHAGAVDRVLEMARERGARRAVRLPMSVPVHCVLMTPAVERLEEVLATTDIRAPAVPVVHNADLESHDDPAAIRQALTRQLVRPVRWVETVERLRARGATALIEPGPGRTLTGLHRRIAPDLEIASLHDEASLSAALEKLEG
ncbi:MAG: ACP S-malonyltransferase [Ectothiorhodospiraceae bacterium]|nr:ACP S-malonyltransferase [Ectothiorhodospiraceae bacterium]